MCETLDYRKVYNSTNDKALVGYLDSDYAEDRTDMKSTSRIVYTLNKGPVSWASKKQFNMAISTVTAEFYAVEECVKEWLWLA